MTSSQYPFVGQMTYLWTLEEYLKEEPFVYNELEQEGTFYTKTPNLFFRHIENVYKIKHNKVEALRNRYENKLIDECDLIDRVRDDFDIDCYWDLFAHLFVCYGWIEHWDIVKEVELVKNPYEQRTNHTKITPVKFNPIRAINLDKASPYTIGYALGLSLTHKEDKDGRKM